MNSILLEQLKKILIFKDLDLKTLKELFGSIDYKLETFQSGEVILFAREPLNKAYLLLQGEIKAQMQSYDGKLFQVEKLKAPSLVGAGFLFSKFHLSPVDMIASSKHNLVLILTYSNFIKMLDYDKSVMFNFLAFMGNKLNFLSEKMRVVALGTLLQKVSSYLLTLYRTCGESFELPITKEEMANLFSSTRPSISRIFLQLERQGIIKRLKSNKIKILDCEKLYLNSMMEI